MWGFIQKDLLHGHSSCAKDQIEHLTEAVANMTLRMEKLEQVIQD